MPVMVGRGQNFGLWTGMSGLLVRTQKGRKFSEQMSKHFFVQVRTFACQPIGQDRSGNGNSWQFDMSHGSLASL